MQRLEYIYNYDYYTSYNYIYSRTDINVINT